jgi:hypothetical protein
MSSTTSRVSLYKPAGGENVNVTTDLNNNLDKIDTNLNFRVAANTTARNAISPFWAGLNVRDTDSGKLWVSNGSAPISASWDQIATANTYTTAVNIGTPATGSTGFILRTTGDGADRIRMRGDGQLIFGDGTNSPDTNLYRSAANTLKTDDSFTATGSVSAGGDLITSGQLQLNNGGAAKKNSNPSATATVSNTATETVIATYSIPANDMSVGAVYKLTAFGTVNTSTTPPTLQIRGRVGGVGGAQFATTNAIAQNASNTTRVFKAEVYLVCLATGVSGSVFGQLEVINGAATGTPGTTNPTNILSTASTVNASTWIIDGGTPSTVNTTTTLDLVITAQWASSNAAAVVCRGFAAERIA